MSSENFSKLYPEFNQAVQEIADINPALVSNLPVNPIFTELVDKISTQYLVDGFNFGNKVLARYLRASSIAGGIDEILSVGMVRHRQYDPTIDWTKDYFINEQYKVWAVVNYEDQYDTTIPQAQANQAFLAASSFGSFLGLIMKRFEDQKRFVWYNRLIELYKRYPVVINLTASVNEPDALYKEITYHMTNMTQPSTNYNLAGKVNATPYEEQQLTWNIQYQNEAQWLTSRLFNQTNINNISKIIWGDFLNFNDPTIVAVLDTQDSLYIGLKQQLMTYQAIAQRNSVNYYRTEIYTTAIVPFANGVIFKTTAEGAEPKIDLSTVLTTNNIKVANLTDEGLKAAITGANEDFTFTPNEMVYVMTFDPNTNKGVVRVNAGANSKYQGLVNISFTVDASAGSSYFGR